MDLEKILKIIACNSMDSDVVLQASKELRRESHSDVVVWRIVRSALMLSDNYNIDDLVALKEFNTEMESKQDYNQKTTIEVECTENEKNIMQLLANKHNMNLNDYIRYRCTTE